LKPILLLTALLICYNIGTAQIFFSEDFESASAPLLPVGWTVQTQSSDGGYTTGNDANANANGTWAVPAHTQFAMTNDDVCNCDKINDYLVLPAQDFSSIVGGIDLEVNIHNNGDFGGRSHLMVSLDTGTTWNPVDTFSNNMNWQSLTIPLNAYIGIPHILIAFHFTDGGFWATGLAVDDVILRQITGFNDLIALQNLQEYTKIPESQVWNIPLTALIKNQGTSTSFDAILTTEVYKSPNFTNPIQTFTSTGDTIAPTQEKSLTSGNYQPNGIGNYQFKHIVSTTSFVDGNLSNDTTSHWFEVTDSTYSRDNNIPSYSIDNPGFGNTIEVGQTFDINLTSTMTSLTFGTEGANTGDTATLTIYNTAGGFPTSSITSYSYGFVAKGVQYITIPTHVILPIGTYFVSIKENAMTDTLGILGTSDIYTSGKSFLSLNGGGFVDMGGQGYPAALSLRPNINVPCPTIATNSTQIACFGDTNGLVNITIAGGLPPFSYNWSNAATTDMIMNLPTGTYYVTLTDANNCTTTDSATIVSPTPLVAADTVLIATCTDSCNGAAFAQSTGGTLPYFFQWDAAAGNTISYDVQSLCAGIYQCTITDFRGCTAILISTVPLYSPIDSITKIDASTTGGTDGLATMHYTDSSWTYLWSNGSSGSIANNLSAGWYYITATDSVGCQYLDSIEVMDPPLSARSIEEQLIVQLYPNPTSGLAYLDIELKNSEVIIVEVFNSTGQRLEQLHQKATNKARFELNLDNYSAGTYWVNIQVGKKVLHRKLILVE
jgi:hypothetical protein